jgi:hypothetical protein
MRTVGGAGIVVALVFVASVHADHLRTSQIARGRPETVLGGVDLGVDFENLSLSVLNARFGSPATIDNEEVRWRVGSLEIRAGRDRVFWSRNGVLEPETDPERLTFLEISGGGNCPLACTGRGLRLGDKRSQGMRLYGKRLQHGPNYIAIGWSDDVSMLVEFDRNDKVTRLTLFGPE